MNSIESMDLNKYKEIIDKYLTIHKPLIARL